MLMFVLRTCAWAMGELVGLQILMETLDNELGKCRGSILKLEEMIEVCL